MCKVQIWDKTSASQTLPLRFWDSGLGCFGKGKCSSKFVLLGSNSCYLSCKRLGSPSMHKAGSSQWRGFLASAHPAAQQGRELGAAPAAGAAIWTLLPCSCLNILPPASFPKLPTFQFFLIKGECSSCLWLFVDSLPLPLLTWYLIRKEGCGSFLIFLGLDFISVITVVVFTH